ncbi:endonuclease/exonuclease/phosphatase family protein [Saccharibacillus sp. JS10]|uniref:endonuclease/exonuclease/phosphatase family protein n=1 Tax=Saccharibacillus sp. JS10 TaxID=2950552 RepID=UPI00210A016D|nr:endonuclease/exonuclease/phosphatase family protein [Saccharibacillus sp. JS10]MCQ4087652.1 endonuclease/exonuclease/phosphatase family protein [Saccharibacillus sp. JS10]
MKLLTLNTHAWHEDEQERKISELAAFINERDFDLIALQEVNQRADSEVAEGESLLKYIETEVGTVIRSDNYALLLLQQLDAPYYWTWLSTHGAYKGRYDEGVAVLSKQRITDTVYGYISELRDYNNYKTRRLLAVKTFSDESQSKPVWACSAHCGWWHDEEEPFRPQWDNAEQLLKPLRNSGDPVFLLGDLNNVAQIRDEGYDYVLQKGWQDLHTMAKVKDEGSTILKAIGGWENNKEPRRIDYILCSQEIDTQKSEVVLDGKNGPVVSDHFGVAAEIQ